MLSSSSNQSGTTPSENVTWLPWVTAGQQVVATTESLDEQVESCYRFALKALSKKDQSERSLRRNILAFYPEYSSQVIDAVIIRLIELGYLDELRMAESQVYKLQAMGNSRRRISEKLASQEIAQSAIASALANYDDALEEQNLYELASKRFRQLSDYSPEVRSRRLLGYLSRRGYLPGSIVQVLKSLETEHAIE